MPGPFQIVSNHPSMRVATLLLCLSVAACQTAGEKPAAELAVPAAPASTANPSTVAAPPVARSSGSGGGARGGATTAAARGGGEPVEVTVDPLTQARADCWMKVERDKGLRGIDQRSAFVDKCVADQMKNGPKP
jgi:hypothetical protein